MNAASWLTRARHPLLWVAVLSGGMVGLVLPAGIGVMNDDFGYLGSVIETLRHGRPWTDDWLEPWSASLAALSALAFRLTGSFQFAIQGVQVACAVAAAVGAFLLFRGRGLSSRASFVGALLGLSCPALLWKSTEYTGMVLYVPCLLWAAWAAGERRWLVFFIFWLAGVSTRQSAVAWLALPCWALLSGVRRPAGDKSWVRPALTLGAALLALGVLSAVMNRTQSQRMITDHLWQQAHYPAAWRNIIIGLGIWAAYSGIGALLLGVGPPGLERARLYPGRMLCLLGLGVGAFTFLDHFPILFFEHGSFGGWPGQLYAHLLMAGSIAGWALVRFSLRWDLLLAALAGLCLVVLRPHVWDYYYADIALFAFLGVAPPRTGPAPETRLVWPVPAVAAAVVTLAVFHLCFACQIKSRVDRDWAAVVLSEKALRAGRIEPVELGHAPYGFIGWHLHRHFVRHEGANDADVGGFMRYLRPGAIELRRSPVRFWSDSRSLGPLPEADRPRIIQSEIFRVGWLWYQRTSLLRPERNPTSPAPLNLDGSAYQPRRFPLNDQEWAEDLARARLPGSAGE